MAYVVFFLLNFHFMFAGNYKNVFRMKNEIVIYQSGDGSGE